MEKISTFMKDTKAVGRRVLVIDPGSGGAITLLGELLGDGMEADALLISQKYTGRIKKLCRHIFMGATDRSGPYDYILPGCFINHYSCVLGLIEMMGAIISQDGHIYASYCNNHVFDSVYNLFAFGSGKMLKVDENQYKARSHIEFDEFIRALKTNRLIICNMELVGAVDISHLEQNIRRFTDNDDFIMTVLDKVRFTNFELDICRC